MPILPIDSGRYGSEEMKRIFEESSRLSYILMVEGAVAESQAELGIIPREAGDEISRKANINYVKLEKCKELERISGHEPANIVEALVEVCEDEAKPWVHFGLTSNDLLDTATSLQIKEALRIIRKRMIDFTKLLAKKAEKYRDLPAVGRTHGQHASIIPFGLKFAVWASEFLRHIERLDQLKNRILLCKTLGVVGTGSLMGKKALEVERRVAEKLGLNPIYATTQVVPREGMAELLFFLALVSSTLDRIAIEIRNLQRTELKEVEEPFGKMQIGSSAVPVKRNPVKSERTSSLAKLLRGFVGIGLENINLWHERDLSNSANERFTIPASLILMEDMLRAMYNVIEGLVVMEDDIKRNLELTKGQVFSEFVLGTLIRKGLSRMVAYRLLQDVAFRALRNGSDYKKEIMNDEKLSKYLNREEIDEIFDPKKCFSAAPLIIDSVLKEVKGIE